jgi:5-methylcytosine-specific restriction endonuclease McrA
MKVCTRCNKHLSDKDFYKDSRNGGLRSWCKFCHQKVSSAYQKSDPIGSRRRRQKYRDANPFRLDTHRAHRRALKYGTTSSLTECEWKVVVESHGYICHICGATLTLEVRKDNTLSLDHELPLNRGGKNAKENVLPACWNCNRSKGDRTRSEFKDWISMVYKNLR